MRLWSLLSLSLLLKRKCADGGQGFEYWADPANRQDGFITWQVDGTPSYRLGTSAMAPDTGPDGSQVGQRLIPEEPMSIVLNLGISRESLLAGSSSSFLLL